jgi:hypothetical protein
LTSITIPNSVTSIASNSFTTSALTTVYISTNTASNLGKASPAFGVTFFSKTGVQTIN